ncbi:hypothetical protein [Bradyrhizobium sp. S69]|uniref:hypothetical protein n=1 Tax=Bradyrhizobium sp. S69 TaxID=1641856 RepID=UPI00131B20F3|nr:hypothetical protein [Bradyrhizobium sp. S69]
MALVDGAYRGLFSVLEKPSGELIIPITHGGRYSDWSTLDYDSAPTILEERISIHLSPNSDEFTTIKKSTVLADGRRITAVALTDAAKRKTGFSNIFVRRYENLSGEGYAPIGKAKVGDRLLVVPEHDPKFDTMFSGLYLGHPDVEFKVANKDPMLHIEAIRFRNFQLVVMFSLQPFRSHYTTHVGSNVTSNPKSGSESRRVLLDALMRGKSAQICVAQYHIAVWAMSRLVLRIELKEATNPEAIKFFKKCLRQIPKSVTRTRRSKSRPSTTFLYPPITEFD